MKHKILITTKLKNGNFYKFTLPYKEFLTTIRRDNNQRLTEWIESDDHLPYKTFYEVTKVQFNKNTFNMEVIELTATLTTGNNK